MASLQSFNTNPSQSGLKTRARTSGGYQHRRSTINILVIGSVFTLGYLMGCGTEIGGKNPLDDIFLRRMHYYGWNHVNYPSHSYVPAIVVRNRI